MAAAVCDLALDGLPTKFLPDAKAESDPPDGNAETNESNPKDDE